MVLTEEDEMIIAFCLVIIADMFNNFLRPYHEMWCLPFLCVKKGACLMCKHLTTALPGNAKSLLANTPILV